MATAAPTRKLSVAEILAMRDRGPNGSLIHDASGRRLSNDEATARMPAGGYQVGGWDTSGGGRHRSGGGYQQERQPIHGYSFNKQGGASDYFRRNGGMSAPKPSLLNELYRNQPGQTMGAYDRLQSQKAMDEADPNSGFLADQIGVAAGQGDLDKVAFLQGMLDDRLAQQQAAQGGATAAGAATSAVAGVPAAPAVDTYHAPGEIKFDAGGNKWRWNEAGKHGELIDPAPTFADTLKMQQEANQPPTSWDPSENLGEGTLHTNYGDVSVEQAAQPLHRNPAATFTNGHGSALGGVNFPGQQGTQSAADFFQNSADFHREGNKFAQPGEGYAAKAPGSWGAFHSAMSAKKLLGKK